MSPGEALTLIRTCGGAGHLHVTRSAARTLEARGASTSDIRHALENASACIERDDGRFDVVGPDIDGSDLSLIVALEGSDRVVVVS